MAQAELVGTAVAAFADRARRARQLVDRYGFAAELLRLYGALVLVQERAFRAAAVDQPDPRSLARYVGERVLAGVVEATAAHGPHSLGVAVRERLAAGGTDDMVARWLAGEDLPAVDRYLARASAGPVLEAMGEAAGDACDGPRDERHCPVCGGLPQLAFFAASGDDLVTAPRQLMCSRCAHAWTFPRLTCAACGEADYARLPIYSDLEAFPHIRVDACEACRRYLMTVDLRKDPEAIPVVDELAALPLDLHAQERGLSKVVVNLMEIG